ncbi:MAG: hypothetical protein RIS79_2956 [Verrucomicrobiota bacterium]|jgi:hypothetical protein
MHGLLPFPAHDWATAAQVFFLLCMGHALMDYPLQGEFLAQCKNRHYLVQRANPSRPPSIWIICMTSHCLLHAAAVWLITGCVILAGVEFVLHFVIDVAKCEGVTSFNQDQLLHFGCKAVYVAAAAFW